MIQAALAALVLSAYVPQQAGSAPLNDPALEARVQRLGKMLRCAVCQGMSIADSPAQMARSQLDKVRELVANGQSDDQVLDFFVARYGEWSLLEPRRSGFAVWVWLGPVLMLLAGLGFVAWYVIRPVRPTPTAKGATPQPVDPYLEKVRAEVDR